jgi:UDP-N-acetylglucosamine--N-acetylmuramyl-(pentapeptide) pyrophosphoryl-undecaprenol N-acetylglucosamine transferase
MTARFAAIAGGGTAGHVHPGIAVARALVERGHATEEILYVGSERGIEDELVPSAGFDLVTLPGRGVPREFSFAAASALASLVKGAAAGFRLLGTEKPRVVLSLGGFAAVPCALGARFRRIPVVIHEQNAVPGAANRLISRWARACAVSFDGTALPNAVTTGNPVRPEMLAVDRDRLAGAARAALGVSDHRTLVVVTGGSLGALRLNRAALEAASLWQERGDIAIRHIVGERDWDLLRDERESISGAIEYSAVRYESDMPQVFAAADVVVSRAGASIIAELAAVGLPSVLVPLPGAPGDHQTANAAALVSVGAARMINDSKFTGEALCAVIDELMRQPSTLPAMAVAARSVAHRDAADQVAQLMEDNAL